MLRKHARLARVAGFRGKTQGALEGCLRWNDPADPEPRAADGSFIFEHGEGWKTHYNLPAP